MERGKVRRLSLENREKGSLDKAVIQLKDGGEVR